MKNTLETRLGLFVVLAILAAVIIIETLGGLELFHAGYRLKAQFNTVQDLKRGDRVKMAGVDVGRVEQISLQEEENKVLVVFKLNEQVKVRTDSTAKVSFTGLMGQNFLSLDFGSAQASIAKEGDYLPTVEQPDLGVVMQKIDNAVGGVENLTKSFTGLKLDTLLAPIIDTVKNNQIPITATIANFQAISRDIAEGKGTVGLLIKDPSLFTSVTNSVKDLQDAVAEAKLTLAEARKTVDQVNSGRGTVGLLLHDDKLYNETTASMTNLKEVFQKINQGQGSIGKLINDQDLYKNAKMTMQKLDKATEGLEDQGPLSIIGLVAGSLF